MLYIVSTPIGNLKDITYRAVDVLKSVDLIAAEDTRHTKILMNHYQIQTKLTSYFEHNKLRKGNAILKVLKEGQDVALVSDAGTPGISDPGFQLIRLARENDIPVEVIPGATALIAALTASGLPAHEFLFVGFLPVKPAGRRKHLELLNSEERTIICYESVHRIIKTLKDICDVMDNPEVAVCRELTKKFEEVKKGPCSDVLKEFEEQKPRGEFVVLISKS